ncbi:MAG: hypothetical protein KDB50_16760 [Mycobacterium sp.]|nr:hypothetical protein [Mycobacterium sp.]
MTGASRVFIVCPRHKTGGTEQLHQLCDTLNRIGADASIVYHMANTKADHSVLYPEFGDVKVSARIEDASDSVIIFPEVARVSEFRQMFPQSTIALYWLSYTNAALLGMLKENVAVDSGAIHLFQSYYEYAMIRPFLSWQTWWFFVTDHIHDEYVDLDPDTFVEHKQDVVCFNANKDRITGNICQKLAIPAIGLKGMSRRQVNETLRRCKVYVDNGYHPGKDRMPREAAMHGCVVITNKSGSAAYWEDVPIEEKVTLEQDLYKLIPDVFANYRAYFDKQAHYREVIRSEKEAFRINVENFWRAISAELPPPEGLSSLRGDS